MKCFFVTCTRQRRLLFSGKMIRKFEAGDVPAITDIYNHYILHSDATFETEPLTVPQMQERLLGIAEAYPFIVDIEDGELRGYCYAHLWKERAAYVHSWEATVYIAPSHVGKGIGRRLMERLIVQCREAGCHAIVSCLTAGNMASEALHERLGFKRTSHFCQVGRKFNRWLDVVDYELLL